VVAVAALAHPLSAQEDTTRSAAERLEQLEQRVKVLSRLREIEADSLKQAAQGRSSTSIGSDGFVFRSADGAFRLRLSGYVQADGRFFLDDAAGAFTNTLFIRRARPVVEATVFKYFDFRLVPDFGQGAATLYDAYFEARLRPALAIRAGKFKPPIGLERLESATDIRFVERGFPTNLVPNRDVGFQVGGELAKGVVSYAVGVFNGVADLGNGDGDSNDAKDVAARLFIVPFASRGKNAPVDLGFGVGSSVGNEHGTITAPNTSGLRTPGQATFFKYRTGTTAAAAVIEDGRRTRLAPQAYLYRGGFGLLAEYSESKHTVRRDDVVEKIPHSAWQVLGSFLLTGEKASFKSVAPKKPLDPSKGTWGALELVFRYQETKVDASAFPAFADPAASAERARAWGAGLNWYLAKGFKIVLDYDHTTFKGGAPDGGDRPTEKFLSTRFQTAF
jgi:phosphate-selective porin OprO/OprP